MHSILKLFIDYAKKEGIATNSFIVGGAVRDILLGKELKDIDIAIKGDAINIAKKFAYKINASFVLMDKKFGIARVVLSEDKGQKTKIRNQKKESCFIDICMLRGNSIYDDLSERDITINAMAIPLIKVRSQESKVKSQIIDPFDGRSDLLNKIIRMVSEENLIKDPLRIIRIYRFAATLNFSIEKNTLNTTKRLSHLITSVSVERIADELRYIIRLNDSYKTITTLINNRILSNIFPKIKISSLKLYKITEEILNNPSNIIRLPAKYLEPLNQYFKIDYIRICLKLSTIFHDPDIAKQSAMRLKLSKKEVEFVHKMVLNRKRVLEFYKETKEIADETKIIRLLKELRDDIYPLIILAIAQRHSITPFCKKVIRVYEDVFKPRVALLPIITGKDLIDIFNLKPSPFFKKILSQIEDMILDGKMSSEEEALKMTKAILKYKS